MIAPAGSTSPWSSQSNWQPAIPAVHPPCVRHAPILVAVAVADDLELPRAELVGDRHLFQHALGPPCFRPKHHNENVSPRDCLTGLRDPVLFGRCFFERVIRDLERRVRVSRLADDEVLQFFVVIEVEATGRP